MKKIKENNVILEENVVILKDDSKKTSEKNNLYSILKDCYDSTGIAKINLDNEKDLISVKLNKDYLKNNNREIVFNNVEKLSRIFGDFSKKLSLDVPSQSFLEKNLLGDYHFSDGYTKKLIDIIDNEYENLDPNYRILVFDTVSKTEIKLDDYRYIKVRLPNSQKNNFLDLDDILIHTKGYVKKSDGQLDYSTKQSINSSQTRKYLAFVMGIINTFMYEKYVPNCALSENRFE